jgi:Cu-Zn family superoxide dismutase
MHQWNKIAAAGALTAGLVLGGCSSSKTPTTMAVLPAAPVMAAEAPSPWSDIKDAIAVVHPLSDSNVMGKVMFTQTDAGVAVVADIMGLTPGKHAFHIHEYGDCSDPKGMSAGGHYNPEHEMHGLPGAAHHHPGDMGNLEADADGKAHLEIVLAGVTIAGDKDPILGRSVIIHAKEDDGSQPVGNAGGRIGCGVIGVAKAK